MHAVRIGKGFYSHRFEMFIHSARLVQSNSQFDANVYWSCAHIFRINIDNEDVGSVFFTLSNLRYSSRVFFLAISLVEIRQYKINTSRVAVFDNEKHVAKSDIYYYLVHIQWLACWPVG